MNSKNELSLAYVAHPFGGDAAQTDKVEEVVRELTRLYSDTVFVSPIHTFGFMYEDLDYARGMGLCLALLRRCDQLILCGDWKKSRGCCAEYAAAKKWGMPILFLNEIKKGRWNGRIDRA